MYLAAAAPLLPCGNPSASGWLPEAGTTLTLKSRKRKTFSLDEKCSLLKAYVKLPNTSQWDAAAKQQMFETAVGYSILEQSRKFSK